MKKMLLIVLSGCLITAVAGQNIVKEHYTVSGGLLGAANFTKFNVKNETTTNIGYETKTGFSAGGWLNFPITNSFSIEPQLMYTSYRYLTDNMDPVLLRDGKISYISIPLSLKFNAGEKLAFILGPQVDFLSSVKDNDNTAVNGDLTRTSFSAFAGIELFPRSRVSVFGRYIHGFTNMDNRANEANNMELRNRTIQAGLKLKLFGKKVDADSDGDGIADPKDKCPNVIGVARYDGCPIPDSDNDGINDEQDKCINVAGLAKYQGCPIPDTDKDGINDELDKCINVAGTAKYEGCPVPDTDNDGVNDELDRCPTVAGPANRNGCPVTDRDNDGISDEEDKCPDLAGVSSNRGCPDVPANVSKTLGASAQSIAFGATNAKLTTKSNASLNKIVTIMNENPTLKIRVAAHTDNAGDEEKNQQLTEARAAAVKAYLVSKGISEDRITTEGFGESMPIADNNTAAGRVSNRRVEIKIEY